MPPAIPPRVLIVEDETDIAEVLADYLRLEHCDAILATDGRQALDMVLADPPDLVLLDVMLPGLDGLEVLKAVRRHHTIPVILVTARVEEVDRLIGLNLGADDYICKPFSPREVVARVKAVLRRTRQQAPETEPPPAVVEGLPAALGPWCEQGQLSTASFTRKESLVLGVLARQPGRVFSRSQLLEMVYPDELETHERAIDSHVKNLRKKLAGLVAGHEWIRSVYGVGFCLEMPPPSADGTGSAIH